MINNVSVYLNEKPRAPTSEPQPGSANWVTRAVTYAPNSSCCRFIQTYVSNSARGFLVVTATSLTGALIGALSSPNNEHFVPGLYIGFVSGLIGHDCYQFYHRFVKRHTEKPSQNPNRMVGV